MVLFQKSAVDLRLHPVRPKIVIIGASGHGGVICDAIRAEGRYHLAGVIDSNRELAGTTWNGFRVLGAEEDLPRVMEEHDIQGGIIAVGDNNSRARCLEKIINAVPEFNFVTAVHPESRVAPDAEIGAGTVVLAGAVVNPHCRVGEHCILNTSSSLDHDSHMGDFSSLAPGVYTGGNVTIGRLSAICIGATLGHSLRVGAATVVGAGSLVLGDLPDGVTAYGTPARVVRERSPEEPYL